MSATVGRAARTRTAGAALGVLIDRAGGEPPAGVHPVAWFGAAMAGLERLVYRDTRAAGIGYAVAGASIGMVGGLAVGSTAAATALAVAGRALADAANAVGDALAVGDLEAARSLLPTLVGRDPSSLDAKEVARAVVESVAENTVDAVVAPALWGAVAGAPGALGHRAVNTLDAMVGYRGARYEHFGWASARLDDVAAFVPARLTAGLVMAVRPRAWRAVARAVATQAPAHPSPNAGVAEAAFAGALGLCLGGTNAYDGTEEWRPTLGEGALPAPVDIARAVDLAGDVSSALVGLLVAVALGQGALGAAGGHRWRR